MPKPWDGFVKDTDLQLYEAIGLGQSSGFGMRPGLLIIDVQYRSIGETPEPVTRSIQQYPTSCGEAGWRAVQRIREILRLFRSKGWPVIYPHVAAKTKHDSGRFSDKLPSVLAIPARGYQFVEDIAPTEDDILVPKAHASAFFGTPLESYLNKYKIDSLVVTGCTTSGCIRASVVDASSLNYRVVVPEDAVFDRSETSHAVNLFDIASKYGDVMPTVDLLKILENVPRRRI